MRKTNRRLFTLIIWTCGFFPLNLCFSQNFGIVIPSSYFGEWINIQNRSDVYFQTQWNDWFWLVFLWDPIGQTTVLNIWNSNITCYKQLKWYYTTNYWNFHLLPLDSTLNTNNIQISNWEQWLFYDCRNWNTQYTWVYWHIKWRIWNFWNTQEIRAWVNEIWNWFLQTSPLKLVYSSAWDSRALSGFARDSLWKQSRFVVNMWLSQPECTQSTCFSDSIQVSCDSDFHIYYTINGDEPTCNGTRRGEDKTFSNHTTLKVIACTWSLSSSTKTYQYQKDILPPTIPAIVPEPVFTQWLTNTIDITSATDQWCNLNTNTIQYQFCKSTTNNTNNCNLSPNISSRSWATSTTFDNLTHWQKYYYFVRSKDIAWNTSDWSQSTYSTQDNKGPEITFNPQSWNAALSHTVTITTSDDISKLKNNQSIKYKRQTNDTCDETDNGYIQTQLNIWVRWSESGSISVSTPSSNWEYYLCVLGGTISDTVWNTNDTTRSPWKFIVQDTPTTVSATNSSEQWKSGDIQITLNASSPTSYTAKYTRTSMTDCNNWTTFTDWDEIQKNDQWTWILYLCIADSQWQRWTRSWVYKLDKTPPTWHFINFPSNCLARGTTIPIEITWSDTISWLPDNYVSWNWWWWSDSNTYVATACWQSITGIIRDNAWNMTTLTGTVEICPDSNNFELIYDSSCTSWSVTITVSWDQRHVKKYKRITYNNSIQSTITSSLNRKQFDQNTNWQVEIILNNGSTISWDNLHFNITNIDKEVPQVSIYTPDNIYECETWTIKFKTKDLWCWSWNISLTINGETTSIIWSWEIPFAIKYSEKGDYSILYEITDSVWNKIGWTEYLTVHDFRITWRDFRRELVESWDYLIVDWNWKELSNVQAWSCELITFESWSCDTPLHQGPGYTPYFARHNPIYPLYSTFHFIFLKESLPENKTIQCNFKLSDWDTDINVTGTFKLCTGDINCNPTLHPIFKSWDKFVYYAEKNENYYKYSSWYENITIDIDWDWFSDIARYRYSCIKEEDYCQNIRPRNPCDGEIQGSEDAESYWETICQDLTLFYETNNITDPYACDTTISSRSDREDYEDGLFTMDISWENCPRSDTIPYQSKNQWPRQIRVQVEDEKGRISEKIPTDILNYTTENPTLDLASNNKMNYSRWWNQNMKPAAINSDSFTIVLSASGASLNNWLVWYNDIFVHSLNNNFSILKEYNVLNFDIVDWNQNIYRWLKSVYSGGTN